MRPTPTVTHHAPVPLSTLGRMDLGLCGNNIDQGSCGSSFADAVQQSFEGYPQTPEHNNLTRAVTRAHHEKMAILSRETPKTHSGATRP